MKTKELQIGDLVFWSEESKVVKIYQINEYVVWFKDSYNNFMRPLDDVQPIPLTSEILEANGWERTGGASHRIYGDYNAVIFHWNENRKEIIIDKNGDRHHMLKLDLLYVHQLQHCLKICGIDKEIIVKQ